MADYRLHYKVTLLKLECVVTKTASEEWMKTEGPEIDMSVLGQLILNKAPQL